MTNEERECIREAARRYVRERAPNPPDAVLERIAQIILQAKTTMGPSAAAAITRYSGQRGVA